MRTLFYTGLPLANDPRQVFTVDVAIDDAAMHARVELRYLTAPDRWVRRSRRCGATAAWTSRRSRTRPGSRRAGRTVRVRSR